MRKSNRPKQLLIELIDYALSHPQICFDRKLNPGETILNLTPDKRFILSNLKSQDINDARWKI